MRFGLTMREAMDRIGVSQKELSDMSGLPQPYLSNLLSGVAKEPTWPKAVAIIGALGMTPDEFAAMQGGEAMEDRGLSPAEEAIVAAYRSMTAEGRRAASAAMAGLADAYGKEGGSE